MVVEIRVYRQYDLDLLAIADAGYSLSALICDEVTSYAHGDPLYYYIDELSDFTIKDRTNIRFRFKVPDDDYETTELLRSVIPRFRSNFCKMVLRNALGQQNLYCFFKGYGRIDELQEDDAAKRRLLTRPGAVPISSYRSTNTTMSFGHNTIDRLNDNTSRQYIRLPRSQHQQKPRTVNRNPQPLSRQGARPAGGRSVQRGGGYRVQTQPVPVQYDNSRGQAVMQQDIQPAEPDMNESYSQSVQSQPVQSAAGYAPQEQAADNQIQYQAPLVPQQTYTVQEPEPAQEQSARAPESAPVSASAAKNNSGGGSAEGVVYIDDDADQEVGLADDALLDAFEKL